jgi:hypothetical protein
MMLAPWHDLKLRICGVAANQHAPAQAALNSTQAAFSTLGHRLAVLDNTDEYGRIFLLEYVNRGYVASGVFRHSHRRAAW